MYLFENGHLMKSVSGESEDSTSYTSYEYDENWVLQRCLLYHLGNVYRIGYYVNGEFDHWEDVE